MKNVFKKVAVVVLAFVMVFAMVACGDKEQQGQTSQAEFVLKVGMMGPLTGGASMYGNAVKNGAQIAVDEINASNPVFKIEFKAEDDEADGEKGVNAYNKLKDWGMNVVLGAVTTGSCLAVSEEAFADRIFELTPSASSADVTAGKDNVFQLCFTDPNQGKTAAQYVLQNFKGKKIGAIYNNADAYSTGIYNAFVAELKANGVELAVDASKITFPDDNNTDYSTQVKANKDAGAEVVFLPIYYTPASNIFKEAQKQNFVPTFFGCDGMDGILTMGLDNSLTNGVMLMTPFNPDSTDAKTQSFCSTYKAKYGADTLNQFAADAYDCVYAIYNAAVAAGVTGTSDVKTEDLCTKLVKQFTASSFSYTGLTGSNMTWSTNGEVSKAPAAFVIKDGKYVDAK